MYILYRYSYYQKYICTYIAKHLGWKPLAHTFYIFRSKDPL